MSGTVGASVRPPLQARSRAGWERALEVGLDLLQEGGYEALTVSEVCRRARLSAPSLYARVDGRLGLFQAVYERGMAAVIKTEDAALEAADGWTDEIVGAVVEVFERHRDFLRAVIRQAGVDPNLLERGASETQRFVRRVAGALATHDEPAALSTARMLYTECAFRAMYGDQFWSSDEPESRAEFTQRLVDMSRRLLGNGSRKSDDDR
jgi:AcrR family transcriptional regulator